MNILESCQISPCPVKIQGKSSIDFMHGQIEYSLSDQKDVGDVLFGGVGGREGERLTENASAAIQAFSTKN